MKLRIHGSSLRLRLSQSELRELATRGEIRDGIVFPGGTELSYRLGVDDKKNEISVSYGTNLIDVRVPSHLVQRWCTTDLVTLSAREALPAGELKLTLEKDFACLAPREGEDESDHFARPQSPGAKAC